MTVSRSVRRPGFNNLVGALNPKITLSETAPIKPKDKDLWVNLLDNSESRWDSSTSEWVRIIGSVINITGYLIESSVTSSVDIQLL
jgi:hypothetical protein